MLDGQARARREFARIFAGFDTDANAAAFERLFAADGARTSAASAEAGA
jgi:hypothetical protein